MYRAFREGYLTSVIHQYIISHLVHCTILNLRSIRKAVSYANLSHDAVCIIINKQARTGTFKIGRFSATICNCGVRGVSRVLMTTRIFILHHEPPLAAEEISS